MGWHERQTVKDQIRTKQGSIQPGSSQYGLNHPGTFTGRGLARMEPAKPHSNLDAPKIQATLEPDRATKRGKVNTWRRRVSMVDGSMMKDDRRMDE